MVKPHTPAPRANEVISASIKEMGYAVTGCVKKRLVVIAQGSAGEHEFGFAPFEIGMDGHDEIFEIME